MVSLQALILGIICNAFVFYPISLFLNLSSTYIPEKTAPIKYSF